MYTQHPFIKKAQGPEVLRSAMITYLKAKKEKQMKLKREIAKLGRAMVDPQISPSSSPSSHSPTNSGELHKSNNNNNATKKFNTGSGSSEEGNKENNKRDTKRKSTGASEENNNDNENSKTNSENKGILFICYYLLNFSHWYYY